MHKPLIAVVIHKIAHHFELPQLNKDAIHIKKLAGKGNAKVRNGVLQVRIPNHLQYLFLKLPCNFLLKFSNKKGQKKSQT